MSDQSFSETTPIKPQLTASTLWLMAMICGLCAGGNYFSQPLLHSIQTHFQVDAAMAQLTVTCAQVSYAVGLLFLVPLGDLLKRQYLIPTLMVLTAIGLLISAFAQNIYMLWLGTVMAGLFSVVAQVLIPLATALVEPKKMGQVVGFLMSGLLIGILFATTIAGLLSQLFAWNTVYWVTAIVLLILMALLQPRLPKLPTLNLNYFALFRSMFDLMRTEKRLLIRSGIGALAFGSMSVLFSTMALLMAKSPFFLSDFQIGLIGLSGIVGAVFAQSAGKLADRGFARQLTIVGFIWMLLSWVTLYFAHWYIIACVIGFCLVMLSNNMLHVTNMNIVYQLRDDAKSRINSIYMTLYFIGAASGSSLGAVAWNYGGWTMACVVGLILGLLSGVLCLIDMPNMKKSQ